MRLSKDERAYPRLLLDSTYRILAASDQRGVFSDMIALQMGSHGARGTYQDGAGRGAHGEEFIPAQSRVRSRFSRSLIPKGLSKQAVRESRQISLMILSLAPVVKMMDRSGRRSRAAIACSQNVFELRPATRGASPVLKTGVAALWQGCRSDRNLSLIRRANFAAAFFTGDLLILNTHALIFGAQAFVILDQTNPFSSRKYLAGIIGCV